MRLLLAFAITAFLASCTGMIGGDFEDCGERCDDRLSLSAGEAPWKAEFISIIDREVESHGMVDGPQSIQGGNDLAFTACVSAWTVSGAALAKSASTTCVVVGVVTIETGVGGIAAAVCAAADITQADALLGGVAGFLTGYTVCSSDDIFDFVGDLSDYYLSGFKLFNINSSESEEDGELDDYNTPECAAAYDEYKAVCSQRRSCNPQTMTCIEYIERYMLNIQCAELRANHLYECPHPDDFNWETHEGEVSDAYVAAQNCHTKLCESNCVDQIEFNYQEAFDNICY